MPRDTFTDPLILETLGLHDSFQEKDLEAAILRDMQAFLLEVGNGFSFIASQKRKGAPCSTRDQRCGGRRRQGLTQRRT